MGCGICKGGIGSSYSRVDYSFGVFATCGRVHEHPIVFDKSHHVIMVAFDKSQVTIVFGWKIYVNKIYFHPLIECIHICSLQLTCN
jgi:hypothetical protein